jgi:hypothetical protein
MSGTGSRGRVQGTPFIRPDGGLTEAVLWAAEG